ncbi:ABC transporter permease, partial [Streptomyces sp. SID14478]|nr:ABC transporter permease [Streptomyces sp. SID14478]
MLAVTVLVPLLAALALWAFAWPAARTAPRDLPVGIAGPA